MCILARCFNLLFVFNYSHFKINFVCLINVYPVIYYVYYCQVFNKGGGLFVDSFLIILSKTSPDIVHVICHWLLHFFSHLCILVIAIVCMICYWLILRQFVRPINRLLESKCKHTRHTSLKFTFINTKESMYGRRKG